MSGLVPVWRVTEGEGEGDGQWTLACAGHLRVTISSPEGGSLRLWDESIESIIRKELSPRSNLPLADTPPPPSTSEKKRVASLLSKENICQNPRKAQKARATSPVVDDSTRVAVDLTMHKRGILTASSELCNGSTAALKRRKHFEVPCLRQNKGGFCLKTASMQSIPTLSKEGERQSLVGAVECRTDKRDFHRSFPTPPSLSADPMQLYDGDVEAVAALHNTEGTSGSLFQTASGRSVSISNAAINKAFQLLGDDESFTISKSFSSDLQKKQKHDDARGGTDEEKIKGPPLGIFRNANGQSVSISSSAMKRAIALLNDNENLSPAFPEACVSHHQHDAEATSDRMNNQEARACLFQTAHGRPVSITGAAMSRAVALFEDQSSVYRKGFEANVEQESSSLSSQMMKQNLRHNVFPQGILENEAGLALPMLRSATKHSAKPLKDGGPCIPSPSSIRFMTGGGRSVSVSSSAVKRARDLLGGDLGLTNIRAPAHISSNGIEHGSQCLFETASGQFISVSNNSLQRAKLLLGEGVANNAMELGRDATEKSNLFSVKSAPYHASRDLNKAVQASSPSLAKRIPTPRKFAASFKAPRRLQPAMPSLLATSGTPDLPCHAPKQGLLELVKMYPLCPKRERKSLREFFEGTPHQEPEVRTPKMDVHSMTAETARSYRLSRNGSLEESLDSFSSDDLRQMLIEAGANQQLATKEWVDNHFRWVVWKLACLERSFPHKVAGNLLAIQTVFDELRYRYEREINGVHRSALKRITEGDASASQTMVLCVGTITSANDESQISSKGINPSSVDVQIEVTDGWYSLKAALDPPLMRQLHAGKIFVGQKLKVCGATLLGSAAPMPPLEAFQVMKLMMHINGTYRAHWADKLGFCKVITMPLAFHCVKHDGGNVPRTIIGINRIYPILYYERLSNCQSITRTARAEERALRDYSERRRQVAEEAVMMLEKEDVALSLDRDADEGAQLFTLLESSAEPELLMADMSAAQHAAFSCYQMKKETAKRAFVEKNVCKALDEAHLETRDITPFLKVSVVGLREVHHGDGGNKKLFTSTKRGIITLWHVGEDKMQSLKEGTAFCVSDLIPMFSKTPHGRHGDMIQLRATKSTVWQCLPHAIFSSFLPRKALDIASLGLIPFRSEFDVTALVVHVGRPYACGLQRRQWLFVCDGSMENDYCTHSLERPSLLVIEVSTSSDAFLPIEMSLKGCIIGYCNLVKGRRDEKNFLWVAEAIETSVFSSNLNLRYFSHLKAAAENVSKWAKGSVEVVQELHQYVCTVIDENPSVM